MDTSKLLASVALVVTMVSSASALDCAPCDNVTCIPIPSRCELGRRVCSCCLECRVPEGGTCGPFSAECQSHLVCSTNEGVFVGRPSLSSRSSGTCLRFEDTPHGRVGRSIFRRRSLRVPHQ